MFLGVPWQLSYVFLNGSWGIRMTVRMVASCKMQNVLKNHKTFAWNPSMITKRVWYGSDTQHPIVTGQFHLCLKVLISLSEPYATLDPNLLQCQWPRQSRGTPDLMPHSKWWVLKDGDQQQWCFQNQNVSKHGKKWFGACSSRAGTIFLFF